MDTTDVSEGEERARRWEGQVGVYVAHVQLFSLLWRLGSCVMSRKADIPLSNFPRFTEVSWWMGGFCGGICSVSLE